MQRSKGRDGRKKWWSKDQRLQVIAMYAMTGSLVETSMASGVPLVTIKDWKRRPWWAEMMQEVRREDLDAAGASMQKIVKKAMVALEDRVDNGNFTFDQRTGKVVRIPINAKDALKVTIDLQERQEKIGRGEVASGSQEAAVDRLTKLAEELARFSKAKPVNQIEGEVKVIEEAK